MLFSWNIPPSPSPTESKRLFYKSVSLFLFCTIKGETDHQPRLDAWDKRSDLVLWEDLEGAGGEGGGRGDRDGEDMWIQGLFILMYDKIHYK